MPLAIDFFYLPELVVVIGALKFSTDHELQSGYCRDWYNPDRLLSVTWGLLWTFKCCIFLKTYLLGFYKLQYDLYPLFITMAIMDTAIAKPIVPKVNVEETMAKTLGMIIFK